jgi:hypothetical protein
MKRNPFLIGAGSMIVVVALGIVAAPTAARAIVATLVQVTNTSSNPVMSLDITKTSSQLVSLDCQTSSGACYSNAPSGSTGHGVAWSVPAGQTLVVTDVDIYALPGSGTIPTDFYLAGACTPVCGNQAWNVPSDGMTHQILIPSGLAFPAGFTMQPYGLGEGIVRGYLTSF